MGVVEASRALDAGTLSAEALVRSCLERIAQRNPQVRAFTAWDPEQALRRAREVDAARHGLLAGIPFAAKDIIDSAALPTAYGSTIYEGHRPRTDASCIALAGEQGAVLLGKVVTSEFATQTPGPTRNPLALDRTPGGSSSGPAAAVADGMVPVAFGTQTTGSIIRPAAYCGVVGYKPTQGLIGAAGVKALSPTQDTVGLLTRSVQDAAFFCFGMLGLRRLLQARRELRVAVCESSQWRHAQPEMVNAIEHAAGRLQRSGMAVRRVKLPQALEELAALQPRLVAFEARQALAFERRQCPQVLSERLRTRLAQGAEVSVEEYLAIRRKMEAARQELAALFTAADVLLYPAADGAAEIGLDDSGSPRFGALWTLLQLPALCLPVGRAAQGMPLGAQLVGMPGSDLMLLEAGHTVEGVLAG